MREQFWVYVNEPNDKAFVHIGSCGHCNEGQGVASEKLESNGQWLGPCDKEQATRLALNSGKKVIRWCGFCARELGIEKELK